jgi:ferredoxin
MIYPEECIKCRLCEDSCPFGAIRPPSESLGERERTAGKPALAWTLASAPLVLAAGAGLGYLWGPSLSRAHRTVRLAERVRLEESGAVTGQTDETEAFRKTARPAPELYAEAEGTRRAFARGAALAGLYVAFVIVAKLVAVTVRRRRDDYEADRDRCFACGRCYGYCPNERARRKESEDVAGTSVADGHASPRAKAELGAVGMGPTA